MKPLIIVESYTKTKTISKYLDNKYDVICSLGHINNLPVNELGIDTVTWKGKYIDTNSKIIANIRKHAKDASCIYIASDPDMEGEAIAMHIYNAIKSLISVPVHRIRFHEITKRAITESLTNPEEINQDIVDAQDNPLAISLYILSYDSEKKLTQASLALKDNLKNYISQYKITSDAISIKDAFVINVGCEFDIIVTPQFNSREVLALCLETVKEYFHIDNWNINQPIVLADIYNRLRSINGVQTVLDVRVVNKQGVSNGYSRYGYDIIGATKNGVVYPALDPMVFEVKYPDVDIKGKVNTF
jgi:5S rRNA maturation endonuclease (ribonuclease M5)